MASYLLGQLIKGLRCRKHLPREPFGSGLSRIEGGMQMPGRKKLTAYFDTLEVEKITDFYPYLENQTFEMLATRRKILSALKREELEQAKEWLENFAAGDAFQEGVNLQFAQSCRIRIALLENRVDEQLVTSVTEALRLTFPEFDEEDFTAESLIFEEPSLIEMLAETYCRLGQPDRALQILDNLRKSIELSPEDDHAKEGVALKRFVLQERKISRLFCRLSRKR